MIELRSIKSLNPDDRQVVTTDITSMDDKERDSSGDESGDEVDAGKVRGCCNECSDSKLMRAHIAFWLLGLCNNFGYVVFLSSAHDILQDEESTPPTQPPNTTVMPNITSNSSCNTLECNKLGTATILLADILPTLLIKITAPYFMHAIPYGVRVFVCVACAIASYMLVAFGHVLALSYVGVVFASIGAGLGEITFLSLTSHYPSTSVSYWSSGTGAAGAVGAWAYALFRLGLSPRNSLLVCNVVPVLMAISYWVILTKPSDMRNYGEADALLDADNDESQSDTADGSAAAMPPKKRKRWKKYKPPGSSAKMSFFEKISLFPSLLKYMLPLFFVYYAEYLINQGMYELMIYRHCIFISPSKQYQWFQAVYQIGVFISRSSVQLIPIKHIWVMALLQVLNVGVLFAESYSHIFPHIAITFIFIFYEGLLGGGCYVNAFSRIRKEVSPTYCEFSLGLASVADSCGIALAGVSAIFLHNGVCTALDAF